MFLRSFVTPLVIGLLVCVELSSCNIASSSNSGSSRASKHMVGLGLHSLEELSQLRGRPLFDYVQIFIRDHPKVAGDVVEKLIELIPSDSPANVELKISFRKKIFEVIQRPSTMARDGSCSVCKVSLHDWNLCRLHNYKRDKTIIGKIIILNASQTGVSV